MGWCNGSELAQAVWALVRQYIPLDVRPAIAREVIDRFEDEDCDTMYEAEVLMKDAGIDLAEQERRDAEEYGPQAIMLQVGPPNLHVEVRIGSTGPSPAELAQTGVGRFPCCRHCTHMPEDCWVCHAPRTPEHSQLIACYYCTHTADHCRRCCSPPDNNPCSGCQRSKAACHTCEHGGP